MEEWIETRLRYLLLLPAVLVLLALTLFPTLYLVTPTVGYEPL